MYRIGVDEAGRGCFLGDVVASCVILPEELLHEDWNRVIDSKRIKSRFERDRLARFVKDNCIAYGIGHASPVEIDEYNILQATMLAMHRALDDLYSKMLGLKQENSKICVDGTYFRPYKNMHHECIVKGDDKVKAISAASILAKTTRDDMITSLVTENPDLEKYGLLTNMGYGTAKHREALKIYGVTAFHRKTFLRNIN